MSLFIGRRRRRSLVAFTAGTALAATTLLTLQSSAQAADPLRDVLLVGNSASGTVSFLDGRTFKNLGSINVTADAQQRINAFNPVERIGYESTKSIEGGIRYVDDVYSSPDGRTLYVSRGELQDVAAFDIATKRQIWRTKIDGFKTDHAILSPDGKQFIVSATTAQKAFVLDTTTGKVVNSFATGTYPHGNDYSPDGTRLYNSSIGITSLPQVLDGLKGDKTITVVDPVTYKVLRTYKFAEGVRPAVFTRDNKYAYIQLSYLNGFIQYDLTTGTTVKTVQMPYSAAGKALAKDSYPQNSAHHGMAINPSETKLCELGTIDDYAAIINRSTLTTDGYVNYATGSIPYWSATSVDGNYCFVSLSGTNQISVINYATAKEVARTTVGTFPQRERLGQIPESVLSTLSPSAG